MLTVVNFNSLTNLGQRKCQLSKIFVPHSHMKIIYLCCRCRFLYGNFTYPNARTLGAKSSRGKGF